MSPDRVLVTETEAKRCEMRWCGARLRSLRLLRVCALPDCPYRARLADPQ